MKSPRFKLSNRLWIGVTAPLFCMSIALALPSNENLYHVTSGDTLSQIAESQYGNWVKWHDLYTANRDRIENPHWIYPGQRLRLLTDQEIDFFRSKNGLYAANGSNGRRNGSPSNEWRMLPTQSWERFVFKTNPEVDPQGFDRRSKVAIRIATDTNAEATIASDRIAIQGEIVNARTDYSQVFLGEQVFVRADEELQVGTTYSVTSGPQKLSSVRDGRVGFAYDVMGQVRIIGVRDGLFIGTVIALYHPIERHHLLIPKVDAYPLPKAMAAPAPVNATVLVTENVRENLISQQRVVFLDVGTQDGVLPGMIFRNYLHKDPSTHEEISTKDFLIESELQVLQAQDKFSVAIVLRSRSNMRPNDEVVALTDLSDFDKNSGLQTLIQDRGTGNTLDDLDRMDETQGLGEKEDRELRQLENYTAPSPEGTLEPVSPAVNEEIKVEGRSQNDLGTDLGAEPAPNDGSNLAPPPPTANDLPAEPSAEPPVDIQSSTGDNPTSEAPPIPDSRTDVVPDAPVESTPVVPETPPAPEAPVPSDPFATPEANDPALDGTPETTVEGSAADPMAIPEATPVPSP